MLLPHARPPHWYQLRRGHEKALLRLRLDHGAAAVRLLHLRRDIVPFFSPVSPSSPLLGELGDKGEAEGEDEEDLEDIEDGEDEQAALRIEARKAQYYAAGASTSRG